MQALRAALRMLVTLHASSAQGNLRGKPREVYLAVRAAMTAAFGDKYEVQHTLLNSYELRAHIASATATALHPSAATRVLRIHA